MKTNRQSLGKAVVISTVLIAAFLVSWAPPAALAESAKQAYERAREGYWRVCAKPKAERTRPEWEKCLTGLEAALERDKSGEYADRTLYLMAQTYHSLYDRENHTEDLQRALINYKKIVTDHRSSNLADDAQFLIGILYEDQDPSQAYLEFVKVDLFFPSGDMAGEARAKVAELEAKLGYARAGGGSKSSDSGTKPGETTVRAETPPQPQTPEKEPPPQSAHSNGAAEIVPASAGESVPWVKAESKNNGVARLTEIQHWSAARYTRVVIYVDSPVEFAYHTLSANREAGRPDRLYLDLKPCVLARSLDPEIAIGDGLLKGVRVGQYTPTSARVVLDLESMDDHRVFSLADPFRVVVDIMGERPPALPPSTGKNMPTLTRQLGLGVKRIVLDPGHGGKDPGAISPDGVMEKDLVLHMAKLLKKALEQQTGCEVILTRSDDRFVSLEERTAIANTSRADLFVSLHVNANADTRVRGFQTYYLSFAQDEEAARLAAFENATSTKQVSDLEAILHDLMLNTKVSESSRLASEVQKNLLGHLRSKYKGMKDMGVRHAPFYVLLGAEMPSVLLEIAFLSNEQDARLLAKKAFRTDVAAGLTAGLKSYIELVNQVAGLRSNS